MQNFSSSKIKRVESTDISNQWIERLTKRHGPLMFYLSVGCCDGSTPLCMKEGEMRIGNSDVLLGLIHGVPFYMSGNQFENWKHTKLLIDVVEGGGSSFSLETPEGVSFHIRSTLFSEDELSLLNVD